MTQPSSLSGNPAVTPGGPSDLVPEPGLTRQAGVRKRAGQHSAAARRDAGGGLRAVGERKSSLGYLLGQGLRYLLLTGLCVAFLYPFFWLLAASVKPRGQVFDNRLIPITFQPQNYTQVWQELPLAHWVLNSLTIALLSATLVTVSSSAVAFGFAFFRFPLRNVIFSCLLGTMMLPGVVTLIPNYLIWKTLGFLGINVPLWGGALFGSAFYVFMMRQFYLSLPRDLFEAARVDGCSYFGLFRRIAFPLALPSSLIVFIFEFQAAWENFGGALIYLNFTDPKNFTVPLGISYAMTMYSPTSGGHGDYQFVMVAAVLVTLPMLIIFAFTQRQMISGIATGALKG